MRQFKGSCICESIKFEVSGEPEDSVHCYCKDCRKNSGALGQITSSYSSTNFEISDDESVLKEYTIKKTASGFPKKKNFCGKCGCTIFTVPMKFDGQIIVIRPTLLDDSFPVFMPTKAIFEDEKKRFTEHVEI